MSLRFSLIALFMLLPASSVALGQQRLISLPEGTPLVVRLKNHVPLRAGQALRAELIYPVYAHDTLVLPARTTVTGVVTALQANHAQRIQSRLRGDFTPFRTPVVRFTSIILANGSTLALATGTATDGAPLYRVVASPPRKGLARQEWENGIALFRSRLATLTGPDKRDRLVQFLYTQLPDHPQRIEKGTAWTVETSEPLQVPLPDSSAAEGSAAPSVIAQPTAILTGAAATAKQDSFRSWIIQAYLDQSISSASSRPGEAIEATVAEPIYDADHTLAVPQGSKIIGEITKASPGRMFGRAGTLRFGFRQLVLPGAAAESVQASVVGADSSAAQGLVLSSEGEVKPKPQSKVLVPLALLVLAARPLDVDRDDGAGGSFGKDAVASNSIGVIGFVVGTAAGERNLAAGLGYYGAAVAFYERWIKRGREISFPRDTRLVLQVAPRHSAMGH